MSTGTLVRACGIGAEHPSSRRDALAEMLRHPYERHPPARGKAEARGVASSGARGGAASARGGGAAARARGARRARRARAQAARRRGARAARGAARRRRRRAGGGARCWASLLKRASSARWRWGSEGARARAARRRGFFSGKGGGPARGDIRAWGRYSSVRAQALCIAAALVALPLAPAHETHFALRSARANAAQLSGDQFPGDPAAVLAEQCRRLGMTEFLELLRDCRARGDEHTELII